MDERTQSRLTQSEASLRDGDYPTLSCRTRLLCYFDSGYFSVLAGLENVGCKTIGNEDGWNFRPVFMAARKILALNQTDVQVGIKLSASVYLPSSDEPNGSDLMAAREWAVRVRDSVGAWFKGQKR